MKLIEEIGDVLWYAAALCHHLGYDFADAARANVEKLRKRYPDGWSQAAAQARADEADPTPRQSPADRVAELECLVRNLAERIAAASEVLGRAAERGRACPVCAAAWLAEGGN